MFCPTCGNELDGNAGFCGFCGQQVAGGLTNGPHASIAQTPADNVHPQNRWLQPSQRIHAGLLPPEIQRSLSAAQGVGLAYASQDFKVISANAKAYAVGAVAQGQVVIGGLSRTLGDHWSAFGGIGSIHLDSVNRFKTDVQLKLEDPKTGGRAFFEWSLPFAITLSIDPGESLTFYFARGGLRNPAVPGDYRLDRRGAFAAKSMDTGQIIPIGPLPTLQSPR